MVFEMAKRMIRSVHLKTWTKREIHETAAQAAERLAAESAFRLNEVIDTLSTHHLTQSWGDRLLTLNKTAGFRNDPTFEAAFASVKESHQYNGPDAVAWRLNTLCWAAHRGLKAGDDFFECGVFKGLCLGDHANTGPDSYSKVLPVRQF